MEHYLPLLKDVGFPVAVAVLVLWRFDGHLRDIRDELRELRALLGDRRRNLRADSPHGSIER